MDDNTFANLLQKLSEGERRKLFALLREEFPIHPLEQGWNIPAEVILEAIARSSPLTQRMFRGILAEAAFKVEVIDQLAGWEDVTPEVEHPFDFKVKQDKHEVTIQVKLQRRKAGQPMTADEAAGLSDASQYVVETQKTRAGKDAEGKDTRPYRFGDFDILAVCMEPVTNDWSTFRFTVGRWLIPRVEDPDLLAKYQPVSFEANDDWSDDLATCIDSFLSGEQKQIEGAK